ncbi:MAG: flavodoxin/ferredoxin-dependent (E)-4-hydroxy-3-methylbut-2-enyl-diphosphate synthase, partial [Christensenellaceae bacterium]|nr:flavodoxin/ferredoxin-dependent (E)-4-hydroxy-3-methylbut-2-enyl-diphosphate synthase [Christensenellaceae bacterium]
MTKQVTAGGVTIGGGADVTVQSMTNTDTADAEATLAQIVRLHQAGCQLVRVTVNTDKAAAALPKLVGLSPVPLVADIHFNHRLAIRAAEAGIAKLRINPGNIGGEAHVRELADCLRVHRIPVRIGVNAGSLEKELLRKHGAPTPAALVESALNHARLLEKYGFNDIVLSVKASSARATVDAYRLASKACDYPLHIGVTEAGTGELGIVKSAAALGALLLDGIGDTLRV